MEHESRPWRLLGSCDVAGRRVGQDDGLAAVRGIQGELSFTCSLYESIVD